LQFADDACRAKSCSVLYGSAGYLLGCAFLNKYYQVGIVGEETITRVMEYIISQGKVGARSAKIQVAEAENMPLFWDALEFQKIVNEQVIVSLQ